MTLRCLGVKDVAMIGVERCNTKNQEKKIE